MGGAFLYRHDRNGEMELIETTMRTWQEGEGRVVLTRTDVLWKEGIEELNEGEFLRDGVWEDGEPLYEAEGRDEFRDTNSDTVAGEWDPATMTWEHFEDFERPKENDAKMRKPRGLRGSGMAILFRCGRAVESGFVATEDECEAGGCEVVLREGGKGVNEREGSEREAEKRAKEICVNMKNDGDGSERGKIVDCEEMVVRAGPNNLVCSDEAGKENVFAITDQAWLPCRKEESEEKREIERAAERRFQWKMGPERSVVLILSLCGVDLRSEV